MCDILGSQSSSNFYSMQDNPFFQFSVSTERLTQVFKKITNAIQQNDQKNEKTNSDIVRMVHNLQTKINLEAQKSNMMFTKLSKQISQNSNLMKLYVTDLDNSIKKNEQKIQIFAQELLKTKSEAQKIGDSLKEEISTGIFTLRKEIIGGQDTQQNISIQEEQKKEQVAKLQNFATTFSYFSDQLKKLQGSIPLKIEKMIAAHEEQMKKNQKHHFIQQGLRKEEIYRRLEGKQNQNSWSVNRLVYPSSKNQEDPHQAIKQEKTGINQNPHKKDSHKYERHMSLKLSNSEYQLSHHLKMMEDKILQGIRNELNEFRNKNIVLDEKNSILSRKTDKLMHEIGQTKMILRKLQGTKNEDKAIEELRNYVKWIIRDFQEKLSLKCQHAELENQKRKINERIAIIHENLLQKAQKGQIQRALIFLEGKIKQIILLIASQQNQERDGAMVKTAIKCLSCDKDLQKNINPLEKKKSSQIPKTVSYSRSLTHRTRQKYKQILKQNQTSGNQSLEQY